MLGRRPVLLSQCRDRTHHTQLLTGTPAEQENTIQFRDTPNEETTAESPATTFLPEALRKSVSRKHIQKEKGKVIQPSPFIGFADVATVSQARKVLPLAFSLSYRRHHSHPLN